MKSALGMEDGQTNERSISFIHRSLFINGIYNLRFLGVLSMCPWSVNLVPVLFFFSWSLPACLFLSPCTLLSVLACSLCPISHAWTQLWTGLQFSATPYCLYIVTWFRWLFILSLIIFTGFGLWGFWYIAGAFILLFAYCTFTKSHYFILYLHLVFSV